MTHSKYPSIGQFRQVVKTIKDSAYYVGKDDEGNPLFDYSRKVPTLKFTGTTKIHGTNAGIQIHFYNDTFQVQSRTNIITPDSDNAGFASYVYYHEESYRTLFQEIKDELVDTLDHYPEYYGAVIFGEWCGGNIQKGVGITGLPKMFVVFGIKLLSKNEDSNVWLKDQFVKDVIVNNPELNLYNIFTFGEYSIEIDFNEPEQSQQALIDYTIAVEKECPVAKYFGILNGTGEGVVWTYTMNELKHRFKCKGALHSSSKVKVLVPIDIEKVNSINELVENIVTENRLLQGLDYFRENHIEFDIKNTGQFIKWISTDCIKEELDLIMGSGFEVKEVMTPISKKAKAWFFDHIFAG